MANVRTRGELDGLPKRFAAALAIVLYEMPAVAAFFTGKSTAYLANGLASAAVSGGTAYTSSSFQVPLPATAPAGSTVATVSFTLSSGVLTGGTVTVSGSGYGRMPITFVPADSTGSGATITVQPANTDQSYNSTLAEVELWQYYLSLDFAQMGPMLLGNVGSTTATAVSVDAPGTAYVVGAQIFGVQTGLYGLLMTVTSVNGSGGVTGLAINEGGVGAAIATGLATTGPGAGSGCTVNITAIGQYNWTANTLAIAGWGF